MDKNTLLPMEIQKSLETKARKYCKQTQQSGDYKKGKPLTIMKFRFCKSKFRKGIRKKC